jgi:hypothetical protein
LIIAPPERTGRSTAGERSTAGARSTVVVLWFALHASHACRYRANLASSPVGGTWRPDVLSVPPALPVAVSGDPTSDCSSPCSSSIVAPYDWTRCDAGRSLDGSIGGGSLGGGSLGGDRDANSRFHSKAIDGRRLIAELLTSPLRTPCQQPCRDAEMHEQHDARSQGRPACHTHRGERTTA